MLSLIPKPDLKAADIKLLREYSVAGIAEIKRSASQGTSIRDFEIFGGDWQSERLIVAQLYQLMVDRDSVPFVVHEDGEAIETAVAFRAALEGWREIELQIQRDTDLELGAIQSPAEFQPHDDEWF